MTIQLVQRQPRYCVVKPPMIGPKVGLKYGGGLVKSPVVVYLEGPLTRLKAL